MTPLDTPDWRIFEADFESWACDSRKMCCVGSLAHRKTQETFGNLTGEAIITVKI